MNVGQKEALISIPVPLEDLVRQAQDRIISNFAQTIGKPIEEARPIFERLSQEASRNLIVQRELISDEIKVLPVLRRLSSYLPEGARLAIVPHLLTDFARSMGVVMNQDRMLLSMGRIVGKGATR